DETLRKRRLECVDQQGTTHAAELLACGQQVVLDGVHPDGSRYVWDRDEISPWDLTTITSAQWEEFCRSLAERLRRGAGCTIVKDGLGGALKTARTVDAASLLAPEPCGENALAAMREWKERRGAAHSEHMPHDKFVELCAAFHGSVGDMADELYEDFRE